MIRLSHPTVPPHVRDSLTRIYKTYFDICECTTVSQPGSNNLSPQVSLDPMFRLSRQGNTAAHKVSSTKSQCFPVLPNKVKVPANKCIIGKSWLKRFILFRGTVWYNVLHREDERQEVVQPLCPAFTNFFAVMSYYRRLSYEAFYWKQILVNVPRE